jgi:hypothetical protein
MTTQLEERNKALVLEAFDTLFDKRDYEAAGRFWSPNYVQHSAHIARRVHSQYTSGWPTSPCTRTILSRRSHIIGIQPLTTGTAAHESALERDFVTITTFDSHRKSK